MLQVKYIFQATKFQSVAFMLYKHYYWALNDQKLFLSSPSYFQDAQQQPSAALCPVLFRNGINSRVRNLPPFPTFTAAFRTDAAGISVSKCTVDSYRLASCVSPPTNQWRSGGYDKHDYKSTSHKNSCQAEWQAKIGKDESTIHTTVKKPAFFWRWEGINKWSKLRLTEDVADE